MYRGASWMYRSVASDHRPIHSYVFERAGRRTAVTCQHVLRYRGDSGCSPYAIVAVSKTGFVCRQRSQAVTVPADHVFGADAKFRLEFADRAVPRFMREQCPARTMRFGEGFLTFEVRERARLLRSGLATPSALVHRAPTLNALVFCALVLRH